MDSEILILDAHLHLWDPNSFTLGWLEGLDALNRTFTHELYTADVGKTAGAIYVEVNVAKEEREREIDAIGRLIDSPSSPVYAMVAALDPSREDIGNYLRKLAAEAPHVVGFRQVLHTPRMPAGYCRSPEFIAGARTIGEHGYSFDLCMRPTELADAVFLASECPKTPFILDHCGAPAISEYLNNAGAYAGWKRAIALLSALPNLVCKVSGLVTQAGDLEKSAPLMREMLEYLKAQFGARRLMFGSDWPVCTLAEPAAAWKARLARMVEAWPPEEKAALWGGTARRAYLEPHGIH